MSSWSLFSAIRRSVGLLDGRLTVGKRGSSEYEQTSCHRSAIFRTDTGKFIAYVIVLYEKWLRDETSHLTRKSHSRDITINEIHAIEIQGF